MSAGEAIIVKRSHLRFLTLQRGALDDLKHDEEMWAEAFAAHLKRDMAQIDAYLPKACGSVLDVGSGLGGIDVLLARRFPGLSVTLLDGERDEPVMRRHRETFNNMAVARDFLATNGVTRVKHLTPALGDPVQVDFVISLQAWCFHFEPSLYLDFVDCCCPLGATVILDVRREKPAWKVALLERFRLVAVAAEAPKYERLVFHA